MDIPEDLITLERSAWDAIQAGALTTEQAEAVQEAVTAHASEAGLDRYEVEMALKKQVRHAEPGAV